MQGALHIICPEHVCHVKSFFFAEAGRIDGWMDGSSQAYLHNTEPLLSSYIKKKLIWGETHTYNRDIHALTIPKKKKKIQPKRKYKEKPQSRPILAPLSHSLILSPLMAVSNFDPSSVQYPSVYRQVIS